MAHRRLKILGMLLLLISLLTLHIVDLVVNLFGHVAYVYGDSWLTKVALRFHFDRVELISFDIAGVHIQVIIFAL